jgi:hypothetical protein
MGLVEVVRRLSVAAAVVALAGAAPEANATPVTGVAGCDVAPWGFLGSQRRVICDAPIRPDGSWMRERVIVTPAHQVPFTCYHSAYTSSCSGGYWVDRVVDSEESYPVTPDTVLPDEPGHLS